MDTYFVKKKDADIITNSDGSYYVLPAIVDGEATTVKVDATITDVANNVCEHGLFAVKNVVKDSKGIITRFTNVTNSTTFSAAYGAAGTVEANKVVLGIGSSKASATYWAYDKDTNVYVVDKKYKTITISSVADVETDANDLVYAIKDKDKVLTDVVIVKQDDAALSSDTRLLSAPSPWSTGVTSTGCSTIGEATTEPPLTWPLTAPPSVLEVCHRRRHLRLPAVKVGWKSASQTTWTSDLGSPPLYHGVAGTYDSGGRQSGTTTSRSAVTATAPRTAPAPSPSTVAVQKSAETYYTVAVTYNGR